jgi:hypothetical protein
MRPLNDIPIEGVPTIRSPHRAFVALAGSTVVLIAVTAFNFGLKAEWKRPQPLHGEPLVAMQAVALTADPLAGLTSLEPAIETVEPVRAATVTRPKAPQPRLDDAVRPIAYISAVPIAAEPTDAPGVAMDAALVDRNAVRTEPTRDAGLAPSPY